MRAGKLQRWLVATEPRCCAWNPCGPASPESAADYRRLKKLRQAETERLIDADAARTPDPRTAQGNLPEKHQTMCESEAGRRHALN